MKTEKLNWLKKGTSATKTTCDGLTGHLPDYACLLVGANAGVVGMCSTSVLRLALKVPVFFVITRVDICPE
jgi:GTPase